MARALDAVRWIDARRPAARVALRAAIAIAAASAALGSVAVLEPYLGLPVIFPAFLAIVLVSAGVAGTAYGVVTAALFAAGHAFLFLTPRHALRVEDARSTAILVAFSIAGVLVSLMGGALRRAHRVAREQHRSLMAAHEQREDLLKALTHDVRSPLSVISMSAAMLGRETEDPIVLRRARAIQTSAARVESMLGELVETLHLESGHVAIQRAPVDLARFLVELSGRFDATLAVDRVRFDLPEGLPAAHADPARLERIVVNLLSNALKYAPPSSPVVVGAALRDGQVVVSVADAGPGIPEQELPRVFDKYFRASTARSKEGLGVGLYATRMLVELHGGRVWAESEVGKGTTFHVALPIAPSGAPRPVRATKRAAAAERSDGAERSRPSVRVPSPRTPSEPSDGRPGRS